MQTQGMWRMIARVVLLALVSVTGCMQAAEYEDVSEAKGFDRLVGKRFQTRQELEILGITNDRTYRPRIDYYVITGRPSIGGREVLERNILGTGTVVEVTRILRCANCLGETYRIEVSRLLTNSASRGARG